tara:strand:+ start:2425 stop:3051 length:627 start_codon:yes stop_codon:yes gene_type:complete
MALNNKRYEEFYATTGSGDNKAKSGNLTTAEAIWDLDRAEGCEWYLTHPEFGPLIFQLQQMQDELDYLRGIITTNKDKVSMTLGTSGSTALAGDTTTISTAQANAITANTAKTSMTLGTTRSTALAGDTTTISSLQAREITRSTAHNAKLNVANQANLSKSTAITFGELTATTTNKGTTYKIPVTVVETTISKGGNTTLTKTGMIPLL